MVLPKTEEHAHHWLLETPVPNKPTVAGVCRLCGAKREWLAYIPDADYGLINERVKGEIRQRLEKLLAIALKA